jgi:hypothetical protein
MTAPSTLKQSHDVLKASISDLIVLRDQWGKIESMEAERTKVKAELDHQTKFLTQTQGEVKEATYFRDKYMAEAREKAAESERLTKEIADKRVVVSQLDDYLKKAREKLG